MDTPQPTTAAAADGSPYAIRAHKGPLAGDTGLYSIRSHFSSSCIVLLTGASGYIGSLILEKLLRSTNVGHVYVLLRTRRGASPAERVAKLLQGPLFHLIGEEQASRVTAVAGDILQPGLGLSPEDEAMLVERVDTVIHSAADIRLDAPIHETLKANYLGSCMMAGLSSRMARLRSFVYVSTCYVNINKPPGFQVEERQYPLLVGGKEVDASGVATELLALPVEDAEALAAKYIDLWGFKNTYAMGKNLAEKAVAELSREHDLPLCIVRPALVSAVAAEPIAGYSGNFAGQVGGAVAYLVGLYNDQPEAVASNGDSTWDVVPGDVVAHATIAAAAAAASPAAREHIVGSAAAAASADGGKAEEPLMVVHVNSSSTYPLTMADMFNDGVLWCAAHKRPFTLALSRARGMDPNQKYDDAAWRRYMTTATKKVTALVWILKLLGGKRRLRMAKMLDAGLRTYETINTSKYDLQLHFSAGTLIRLEDCLSSEEMVDWRLVWRPPTPKSSDAPAKVVALSASAPSAAAAAAPAPAEGLAVDAKVVAAAAGLAARKARVAAALQRSREGGWTLFHANVLAYLWKMIYGKEVPRDADIPLATVRRLMPWLSKEQAEAASHVRHTYEPFA